MSRKSYKANKKHADISSIKNCMEQADPLTVEIVQYLLNYSEEDDCLDYKLAFDGSDREWLELTKDISAFANTWGGYLVFGVENKSRKAVGATDETIGFIEDSNSVQQKINSYIEPPIGSIRTKIVQIESVRLALIYVPQSRGITHMIKKDGSFQYASDQKNKIILRQGTFFVRRVAGNHLGDARDLEGLIERRIEQFRDSLMGKIATVVKSPQESEILVVSSESDAKHDKRIVLSDSEDAIPVKGMSFSVAPQSTTEEIAAWYALSGGDSRIVPSEEVIWRWFHERRKLKLSTKLRLALFKLGIWKKAPKYFWVKNIDASKVRKAIAEALKYRPNNTCVQDLLEVSAYLGRHTYNRTLAGMGEYKEKLNPRLSKYPEKGPKSIQMLPQKGANEDKKHSDKVC